MKSILILLISCLTVGNIVAECNYKMPSDYFYGLNKRILYWKAPRQIPKDFLSAIPESFKMIDTILIEHRDNDVREELKVIESNIFINDSIYFYYIPTDKQSFSINQFHFLDHKPIIFDNNKPTSFSLEEVDDLNSKILMHGKNVLKYNIIKGKDDFDEIKYLFGGFAILSGVGSFLLFDSLEKNEPKDNRNLKISFGVITGIFAVGSPFALIEEYLNHKKYEKEINSLCKELKGNE